MGNNSDTPDIEGIMKKTAARIPDRYFLPIVFSLTIALLLVVVVINKPQFGAMAKVSELGGLATLDSSTIIIPDNNVAGKRAEQKLVPTTSYVIATCNDPDECDVHLDDSVGTRGDLLYISAGSNTRVQVWFSTLTTNSVTASFDPGYSAGFIHDGKRWTSLNI